jgi:hypothetical protein
VSARSLVTFRSPAFNTTEPREHFINSGCYGDDVLFWLSDELRRQGVEAAEVPRQEDFGWYLRFASGGSRWDFVVGYRPADTEPGQDVGTGEDTEPGTTGSLASTRRAARASGSAGSSRRPASSARCSGAGANRLRSRLRGGSTPLSQRTLG